MSIGRGDPDDVPVVDNPICIVVPPNFHARCETTQKQCLRPERLFPVRSTDVVFHCADSGGECSRKTHCGEHSAHTGDSGPERPGILSAFFARSAAPSNAVFWFTQERIVSRRDAPLCLCTPCYTFKNFCGRLFRIPERCPCLPGKRFRV